MSGLLSIMWFIIGIIWIIAGKSFLETTACFLLAGVFSGAWELYLMRKEMEDFEENE